MYPRWPQTAQARHWLQQQQQQPAATGPFKNWFRIEGSFLLISENRENAENGCEIQFVRAQ